MHFIVPSATAAGAPHTFQSRVSELKVSPHAADQVLSNGIINLTFSGATGCVSAFSSADVGSVPFSQSFSWYNASAGVPNGPDNTDQPSGAYIFRPNSSTLYQALDLAADGKGSFAPPVPGQTAATSVTLVTGPVVSIANQASSMHQRPQC
jgi:hypothetical protein